MITAASRPGPIQAVRPRLRLSRRSRQAVLVLHIIASGAWIGIDVIVAVLVVTGWFSSDIELRSVAYRALAHFLVLPMIGSGLVCLGTGVVLGLGTKWGLIRYWWVALKLVMNVVLCILMITVLSPGMPEVDRYGVGLITGAPSNADIQTLFFPPAVSLTALTVAVVLGVAKPWGRVRRGGAQ
ncbi:MAG TPA: hypothetical protein PKI89_11735 [Tepidiformaceae bacterium]|nr:hypothetical protein [Tepidiformaceae bacterium]